MSIDNQYVTTTKIKKIDFFKEIHTFFDASYFELVQDMIETSMECSTVFAGYCSYVDRKSS